MEKNIKSRPQTGSWYLLGVLFKIPDEHPRPFLYANPPLPPGAIVTYRFAVHIMFLVCHLKFKSQVIDRNLIASGKILHRT